MFIVAVSLSLHATACGDGEGDESERGVPEGPWVTSESSSVTMHARPDDGAVCPEHLVEIEQDLRMLWDYFDVPDQQRVPIEWYRYKDQNDYDEHGLACPGDEAACAMGPTIFSAVGPFEHELVHAALQGLGHAPDLFTEGVRLRLAAAHARAR